MNLGTNNHWHGRTLTPADNVKKVRLCRHNTEVHKQVVHRLSWALSIVRQQRGFEGFPDPDIGYFDRALAAGKAGVQDGRFMLLYNRPLFEQNLEENLHETVIHELAHLVVIFARQNKTWSSRPIKYPPHGPHWRKVMVQWFSVIPQRTHSMDTSSINVRRQRRWPYRCQCKEHMLSTVRHNRVQKKNAKYSCQICGTLLKAAGDTNP